MKRLCKRVRKQLIPFLNQQLGEEEAREIEQHLSDCSTCRQEEEALRSTWNLLGRLPMDTDFPDRSEQILSYIDRQLQKSSLFGRLTEKIALIPAPALALLVFILAIPPGTLLGKNLYFALSGSYHSSVEGASIVYTDELPLDVFGDFPQRSLGNVYINLVSESSEEEK